mmetsp:Transcript_12142/g.34416  ORF Transcript_12142/g.34416 Transcript_12142/m.34416 type:complete len:214 (+) Transcript_12142:436-1077(+)
MPTSAPAQSDLRPRGVKDALRAAAVEANDLLVEVKARPQHLLVQEEVAPDLAPAAASARLPRRARRAAALQARRLPGIGLCREAALVGAARQGALAAFKRVALGNFWPRCRARQLLVRVDFATSQLSAAAVLLQVQEAEGKTSRPTTSFHGRGLRLLGHRELGLPFQQLAKAPGHVGFWPDGPQVASCHHDGSRLFLQCAAGHLRRMLRRGFL